MANLLRIEGRIESMANMDPRALDIRSSYFLPIGRVNGDAGVRDRLRAANISYGNLNNRGSEGIVVSGPDINNALRTLNLGVGMLQTTDYDGTYSMVLSGDYGSWDTASPPTPRVPEPVSITLRSMPPGSTVMARVIRAMVKDHLVPIVGNKITVTYCGGRRLSTQGGRQFYLNLWGSPSTNDPTYASPSQLWGVNKPTAGGAFRSTGRGDTLFDNTGIDVGELVSPRHMYIHHNVLGSVYDTNAIMLKLITEVAVFLRMTPEQRRDITRNINLANPKADKQAFVSVCIQHSSSDVSNLNNNMRMLETRLEQYQRDLVRTLRDIESNRKRLSLIDVEKKELVDFFADEFDRVMNIGRITKITAAGSTIQVFTDMIYCKNPDTGKIHEIGKFRIDVHSDGGSGGVRMFNLTRTVRGMRAGMHGPHVFEDGRPCLGTISEVVPELVGKNEIAAVVSVCIQYLESVNTSDAAGKYVGNWPLAEGEKKDDLQEGTNE